MAWIPVALVCSLMLCRALTQTATISASPVTGNMQASTSISTTTSLRSTPTSCKALERCATAEPLEPTCAIATIECICVLVNTTRYVNCVKGKCPDTWKAGYDNLMNYCADEGVDLSGNTTYTATLPSFSPINTSEIFGNYSFDLGGKNDGLSQSDKIAIGIGVGFGVPSLLVGLGAWLCVRRRGEKPLKNEPKKVEARQPSAQPPPRQPEQQSNAGL